MVLVITHICGMEATSYPKEKIKVLLLENVSETAVKNFIRNGYTQVEKLTKALPEEDLINAVKNVHLLGIRSKTQVTPAVLAAAKKLQAIGCFCIHFLIIDYQISSFHQHNAHLSRKKRVLVISRIINAGGKQHCPWRRYSHRRKR